MSKSTYITVFAVLGLTSLMSGADLGRPVRAVHEPINEANLTILSGNTRPEVTARTDQGRVSDEFPLDHMTLQLRPSAEREAALKAYVEQVHDPQSSNFHKWLTPEEYAAHFGVAKEDVETVTGWLKSHGFTVHGVQPTGMTIDFSGTAGQVRRAYHTEIHNVEVNGERHFANMSDPQIPAALEPVIAGVVALHNFRPQPMLVPKRNYTFTNNGLLFYALVPGDIATIYNLNPVFAAGYTGLGQSIMVLEDTYLYSTADWGAFRSTFGLTAKYPAATLTQLSPQGKSTCTSPGFVSKPGQPGYGDDSEAALDVEWATAAAPNAAIILAACKDTATTFGGLLALSNVLNGPAASLPTIVSISYGESEAYNGAAGNLAYFFTYLQAAAEGVSIFGASGDWGAAVSDLGNVATHGININGLTSTPYNVSVGGLDFGYAASNVPGSTYFSNTNNSDYSSALSYIPEVPWNDSCAGGLAASFLGFAPLALCNSPLVTNPQGPYNFLLASVAGSGGPSGCATGAPSTAGVVSGTCQGWAKPSWQQGLFGNPSDGVRDVPDVSLFASNGFWGSYYIACWSNPDTNVGGGFTCSGAPSTWAGFGGTSISSPIMAGIQALINEKTASRWGNPNAIYYALAKLEYASGGGLSFCNSTTVPKASNSCVFYDVTQGDNDVVCRPKGGVDTNCYHRALQFHGVLSTTNSANQPAYLATPGWDFTSGIGSVNAWNLVQLWPKGH